MSDITAHTVHREIRSDAGGPQDNSARLVPHAHVVGTAVRDRNCAKIVVRIINQYLTRPADERRGAAARDRRARQLRDAAHVGRPPLVSFDDKRSRANRDGAQFERIGIPNLDIERAAVGEADRAREVVAGIVEFDTRRARRYGGGATHDDGTCLNEGRPVGINHQCPARANAGYTRAATFLQGNRGTGIGSATRGQHLRPHRAKAIAGVRQIDCATGVVQGFEVRQAGDGQITALSNRTSGDNPERGDVKGRQINGRGSYKRHIRRRGEWERDRTAKGIRQGIEDYIGTASDRQIARHRQRTGISNSPPRIHAEIAVNRRGNRAEVQGIGVTNGNIVSAGRPKGDRSREIIGRVRERDGVRPGIEIGRSDHRES